MGLSNMVNTYALKDKGHKKFLWLYVTNFMHQNPGCYILFRDFDAVRDDSKRFEMELYSVSVDNFNFYWLCVFIGGFDGWMWFYAYLCKRE